MYTLIYIVLEEDKLGLGLVWLMLYTSFFFSILACFEVTKKSNFPKKPCFVIVLEKAKLGPRLDDSMMFIVFLSSIGMFLREHKWTIFRKPCSVLVVVELSLFESNAWFNRFRV